MDWKYYEPCFESDEYNKEMIKYSPWSGHRYFVYDLIASWRPKRIVELGSFYGCSTFAMAQAAKDFNLSAEIFAVDIWESFEDYTHQDYVEDIYGSFLGVRERCRVETYIKPLKMTFSDASRQFERNSIDLLHIDGSHYYDDVKRDFTEWLPYVKEDGVILFHDVGDTLINGHIMGSHIFWNELKERYQNHFEFMFSCGLGIICLNQEQADLLAQVDFGWYQKKYNLDSDQFKDELRKKYFETRDKGLYIEDLKKQIEIKDEHLKRYERDRKKLQQDYERDRKKLQQDYERTIEGKDLYIKELEDRLK